MRERMVSCLRDALPKSDAQLLAYAIMPNHLHLVVRQGSAPLSALMQPLCQSIALNVQRTFGHEGYVFERRFRDRLCMTARHLRNAIVYTHQNPVLARLCESEIEFRWSSACDYIPEQPRPGGTLLGPQVFVPLRLFAVNEHASWQEMKRDYGAYSAWAVERKRCRKQGHPAPPEPLTPAGDLYWQNHFGRLPRQVRNAAARRPDLRDLANSVLNEVTPGFTVAQLRLTRGGPDVTRARHLIITRALLLGFRGCDIARYLHISPMTISRVKQQINGPGAKTD